MTSGRPPREGPVGDGGASARERSREEIDAVIEESEAAEVAAHAAFLGDVGLLREAKDRMAAADGRAALARHLRLGDAVAAELNRLGTHIDPADEASPQLGGLIDWPEMMSLVIEPFDRVRAGQARDRLSHDIPRRGDVVSAGPLSVRRRNVSKTDVEVLVAVPGEWTGRFLPLEVGEPLHTLSYLVALFAQPGASGAGSLHVATRARVLRMRVGCRPLAPDELQTQHVDAVRRSLWALPVEGSELWRALASSRASDDPVCAAITATLSHGRKPGL